MKYTLDTRFGELLGIPQVKALGEKISPEMFSGLAVSYLSGMTPRQLIAARADVKPLVEAILAVANGAQVDLSALDPRKKKPTVTAGPFGNSYDPDDVDGRLYMINHSFSGCCVFGFSKKMDESVKGQVTYAGREVPYVLAAIAEVGGNQMFGIFVRDICTDYGKTYVFHVEGFRDLDGNTIDPQDITVRTVDKKTADPAFADHDAVALEAAREGMVLLKNDNHLLPLTADAKIALVGANEFRLEAVGAGKINPRYKVRLREAIEMGGFQIVEDTGMLSASDDIPVRNPDESAQESAVAADSISSKGGTVSRSAFMGSRKAEDTVCLLVISRASGENFDNGPFPGQYYLTEDEEHTIAVMEKKYSHIVAIINSGYPMDVSWTKDKKVEAVLWTGFCGMLGGKAVVDILNGSVNPSGRLPDTWALDYDDIPSSKNFYVPQSPDKALGSSQDVWIDTVYEEDIYVGYRYFDTFGKNVAYPFGYGLSYTEFNVTSELTKTSQGEELGASAQITGQATTSAKAGEGAGGNLAASTWQVKAVVTNQGARAGKEVVQVYAGIPSGRLEQPDKRLVGFAKTKLLAPGESQTLVIPILTEDLTSYDEAEHAYIMEKGNYTILTGTSAADTSVTGTIVVEADLVWKSVGDYMKPPVVFTRLSKDDPASFPKGEKSGIVEGAHSLQHTAKRTSIPAPAQAFDGIDLSSWSDAELARLCVCASPSWGMQDTGVAGRMYQVEGKSIPAYSVADGNNGVNINKPNIGMPTSNLVAATWNRDLAYQVGAVIGEEARENDVQMILAPAMNIHRNPLCGRHPEYFSEDPLLSGTMAGYQLKGLEEHGTDGCVKHVCCNNAESSRKRNHSIVSQRALRELYLRNFAIAFRIHQPAGIMTGYNACNGVFTAEDAELILGVFRKELGFRGVVMTDWNSYDTADVARAAEAGMDWFTPGSMDATYTSKLMKGLEDGTLTRQRLEDNVRHILAVIRK